MIVVEIAIQRKSSYVTVTLTQKARELKRKTRESKIKSEKKEAEIIDPAFFFFVELNCEIKESKIWNEELLLWLRGEAVASVTSGCVSGRWWRLLNALLCIFEIGRAHV